MMMMAMLHRQVPARRWFAWIALLAILYFGVPAAWTGIIYLLRPAPTIQVSDHQLAAWAVNQGWLSAVPRWVAIEDPTAYAAPSPWGAAGATLSVGDLDPVWPDQATAPMFREFALLHELSHVELEVARPVASDPRIRPLGELVHVVPMAFWVQVFDEAHADWQASVMLLHKRGPAAIPFLRKLVAWRRRQALFAPIDPHQQLDLVSPWLDQLADPQRLYEWQHQPVPVLRQRLFDDTLHHASAWLALHPQDQSDLFRGTTLRPLLDRPLSWPQRQQAERHQYEAAWQVLGRAPRPPRDPSPSQTMLWLESLSGHTHPLRLPLLQNADRQWIASRRQQARESFMAVQTAAPAPP